MEKIKDIKNSSKQFNYRCSVCGWYKDKKEVKIVVKNNKTKYVCNSCLCGID